MSLNAFTNSVGDYSQFDLRQEHEYGRWFDYWGGSVLRSFDDVTNSYTIEVGKSLKPIPIKGNRRTPERYSRQVYSVLTDNPYILFEANYPLMRQNGYERFYKRFISKAHTPFSYSPFQVRGSDMENARKEARVKALNRLKENKVSLGNAIAEIRQTVDLFAEPVIKGARFLLAMKRGQIAAAGQMLGFSSQQTLKTAQRTAAQAWLTYSYGWSPLAGDLEDLQKVLHEKLSAPGQVLKAHGTSRFDKTREFTDGRIHFRENVSGKVRSNLQARIRNVEASQLEQYGLANPAAIAWELVPWSFAIDWFMPVGQTLEAATATLGLDFHMGWESSHNDYTLDADYLLGYQNPWVQCIDSGAYQEKGYRFEREPYFGFPRAEFFADTTPYSTTRALNALALVRQLMR